MVPLSLPPSLFSTLRPQLHGSISPKNKNTVMEFPRSVRGGLPAFIHRHLSSLLLPCLLLLSFVYFSSLLFSSKQAVHAYSSFVCTFPTSFFLRWTMYLLPHFSCTTYTPIHITNQSTRGRRARDPLSFHCNRHFLPSLFAIQYS